MTVVMGSRGFDALFEELYAPAFAVALRILGDPYAAEDAACEALAKSFASWRRVQAVQNQRAWVMRVTTNVAIDIIRRRRTIAVGIVDDGRTTTFASEDRLRLVAALERLPRRQREVVVLRFMADMTEVQVAEQLCISQGAVKQHARRGLAALRRILGSADALDGAEVNLAY